MSQKQVECSSPISEGSSVAFSPYLDSELSSGEEQISLFRALSFDEGGSNTNFVSARRVTPSSDSKLIQPAFFSYENPRLVSTLGKELISQCEEALQYNLYPLEVYEGVTGAFMMKKRGGGFAGVFKAEESMSRRASYSFDVSNLDAGLRRSDQSVREVAAFLLDHGYFARVPETLMVRVNTRIFKGSPVLVDYSPLPPELWKLSSKSNPDMNPAAAQEYSHGQSVNRWLIGSLQRFIKHDCDAYDVSHTFFDVEQVHHLGIFDVRTLNTDRHEGNVLVQFKNKEDLTEGVDLVPIDHGVILPDYENVNIKGNFCWMLWPQSKQPFSDESKNYIKDLDAFADRLKLIRMLGSKVSPKCLMSLIFGTLLLKIGVLEFGLTLYEIGELIVGDFSKALTTDQEFTSPFVDLIKTHCNGPEDQVVESFSQALRVYLAENKTRV